MCEVVPLKYSPVKDESSDLCLFRARQRGKEGPSRSGAAAVRNIFFSAGGRGGGAVLLSYLEWDQWLVLFVTVGCTS